MTICDRLKRMVCLLLTVCIILPTCAVSGHAAEASWKEISSVETAVGREGEYVKVETPADKTSFLRVSGKATSEVKMLLISIKGVDEGDTYVRTFVEPDAQGKFSVEIKTAKGCTDTPKAAAGRVYGESDKAWDSMPGHRQVERMPAGLYQLNITTANTEEGANVCDGAPWYKGTLNGNDGYYINKVFLAVTDRENDPKLIEFSGVVQASQKVRESESVTDPEAYARYTDVRLKDMAYLLKDNEVTDPDKVKSGATDTRMDKPMTDNRVAYIRKVAQEVTAGASTDYEKLRQIYYYVTSNFYYDYYAFSLGLKSKQNCNPYDLLYNLRNGVKTSTSTADGKVATVCDGYSALVVSMCRTLGIPARSVCGTSVNPNNDLTVSVNTSKLDHWWAEVYVDGRWVTVDANLGAVRQWKRASASDTVGTWEDNGISIQGFDISPTLYAGRKQMVKIQDDIAGRPYVKTLTASVDPVTGKPCVQWEPVSGYSYYYIYRGTSLPVKTAYASARGQNSFVDVDAKAGTTYYYIVRPVSDSKVEGAPSDAVSCKSEGGSFVLTATYRSDTESPYLCWTDIGNSNGYRIYRGTSPDNLQKWKIQYVTTFTDKDFSTGTTYYYKVVPLDANGAEKSTSTNVVSLTVPGPAPAAPDKPVLKATYFADSGHIRLRWDSVANATMYQLYRSTNKDSGYTRICTNSANGYTDESAKVGVTYYYKLQALAGSSASPFSDVVSAQRRCAKPELKTDYLSSSGKPYLKWNAVNGAVSYELYRSLSADKNYSRIAVITGKLTYTDNSAAAGKKYYYKLKAVASSGVKSDFCAAKSVSCRCAKPTMNTGSYLSSTGKPYLSWKFVTGAAKYEVYRSGSKNGTYKLLGSTTKTNYTDSTASTGYTYYYKIKAVDAAGVKSSYSAAVSAVSHCARPVVKSDYLSSTGKPYLSWKSVTGAKSYEVYRSTSKNGTYKLLGTTTKTNYTDSTASTGYTYYYKIKVISKVKSAANSSYSTAVSATSHCARPVVSITTSKGDPKLTWKAVTGAKSYEVYRATSKNGTYTKIGTTTKTSYTNTSAKAGKTYYYKVKAVSKVKTSANSSYSLVKSIKAK